MATKSDSLPPWDGQEDRGRSEEFGQDSKDRRRNRRADDMESNRSPRSSRGWAEDEDYSTGFDDEIGEDLLDDLEDYDDEDLFNEDFQDL